MYIFSHINTEMYMLNYFIETLKLTTDVSSTQLLFYHLDKLFLFSIFIFNSTPFILYRCFYFIQYILNKILIYFN